MKRKLFPFLLVLLCALALAACASVTQPSEQPPSPATSAPQEVAPPAQPTTAPPPSSTTAPAAPAHKDVPGDLPSGKGMFLGDQSTVSSYNAVRALVGDRFTLGKFERPYNSDPMDVYYPFLDIVSANFYPEPMWVFVRITLVSPDSNNGFPAKYAVEVDTDMDGRGDFLVMVDHPSSTTWSTDGVQVLEDRNGDVGGENIINSDSEGKGDGYEYVLFDQGQGDDPDAAWARISPSDPNSLEMAFKTALLQGDDTYMAGIWAGADSLNPSLFDLNDHFTHEQAGEANPDIVNFYPIKGLYELDNTCRQAIGFKPTGNEPALCSQG